jgi:hypothetical protein
MSAEINAKSFCRKNNSYFGKVPMESILKSFWFYCKGLHTVSDMILKDSLEREEKNTDDDSLKNDENH